VPILLTLMTLLAGCATVDPDYESPSVTVSSFRAIAVPNGIPNFEIGLRVLNPNATPLELRGISFAISLDGQRLIRGVGNELPVIKPYGAGNFTVTASANVLAGIRFFANWAETASDEINYEFKAKLDVGALRRAIRIKESGSLSLGAQQTN
ncbi:MAG: LEA type 2 family protein, partial [Gammaproteobacteria bacterium]|nr:LEA type 2 family protein [Gammaproteobacteria bacterium]